MDQILAGTKTVEYKACNDYWTKRLTREMLKGGTLKINFLCGRRAYKYIVTKVEVIKTPENACVVGLDHCFALHLGERVP